MFEKPLKNCNTFTQEYQDRALINPLGFREYDARWLIEEQLNLTGAFYVGMGLGTLLKRHHKINNPPIIVGHDYRQYSQSIKMALVNGLIKAGCVVNDIGLCTTPMAYFAQAHYAIQNVAMVTASHNENGWTGIKMGLQFPLTFSPDNMSALKDIVMNADFDCDDSGKYILLKDLAQHYKQDITQAKQNDYNIKAVIACGNGTPAIIAPDILHYVCTDSVERHCELNYHFPHYNPNPEDLEMLTDVSQTVKKHKADIGFAFDGDGDRCGIIDENGRAIFADKIGLIIARNMALDNKNTKFIVDVKSTGLFLTDEILKQQNCEIVYWKTGHSHIKSHCKAINAIAAFEKSGHYFFNPPYGYGYDDGLKTALVVLDIIKQTGKSIGELYDELPVTYISPTMSPYCPDDKKYAIVEEITQIYTKRFNNKEKVAGRTITDILTVNGIRFNLEGGGFGLVRASSNKPELVIVTEDCQSQQGMKDIFMDIEKVLSCFSEIGEFNQKL